MGSISTLFKIYIIYKTPIKYFTGKKMDEGLLNFIIKRSLG